jgi:hypothetical protein
MQATFLSHVSVLGRASPHVADSHRSYLASVLRAAVPEDTALTQFTLLQAPLPDLVTAALLPIAAAGGDAGPPTDTAFNRVVTSLLPTESAITAACASGLAPGDSLDTLPAWYRAQARIASAMALTQSQLCTALLSTLVSTQGVPPSTARLSAALYLLSNLSSGVTGTVHYVDTGAHLLGPTPPL